MTLEEPADLQPRSIVRTFMDVLEADREETTRQLRSCLPSQERYLERRLELVRAAYAACEDLHLFSVHPPHDRLTNKHTGS